MVAITGMAAAITDTPTVRCSLGAGSEMPPEQTQWTLRLPVDTLKYLKDTHAESFAEHRLSFNAWVLECLQAGVKK